MRTLRATLTALAMLALFAIPALAGGDGGDTVTKTFELTLYGEVPGDQAFIVTYVTGEQLEQMESEELSGPPPGVVFCGQPAARPAEEDCVGGGTVYTGKVEFERGEKILFAFVRANEGEGSGSGSEEIFFGSPGLETGEPELEILTGDRTNEAFYSFDTRQGGPGDDPQAPAMPDTGAGGMAGGRLPLGGAAILLSLMAARYAVRRRH